MPPKLRLGAQVVNAQQSCGFQRTGDFTRWGEVCSVAPNEAKLVILVAQTGGATTLDRARSTFGYAGTTLDSARSTFTYAGTSSDHRDSHYPGPSAGDLGKRLAAWTAQSKLSIGCPSGLY